MLIDGGREANSGKDIVKSGKFSDVKVIVCGHVEKVMVTRLWYVFSNTSHAKPGTFLQKGHKSVDLETVTDNVPQALPHI